MAFYVVDTATLSPENPPPPGTSPLQGGGERTLGASLRCKLGTIRYKPGVRPGRGRCAILLMQNNFHVEPPQGFEPWTYALRVAAAAVVLSYFDPFRTSLKCH